MCNSAGRHSLSFCNHPLTYYIFAALLLLYFYVHSHSAAMAERRDYHALAQDINLEDITSCERNANILRKIRDGDPNWNKKLFIVNEEEDDGEKEDFVVREGDDLGWLGYFIGCSEVIEYLYICYLPEGGDEINSFFEGMSQNRSIEELEMHSWIGDDSWISLGSFLGNNHNLSHLEFQGIAIGHEDTQNLASALDRMNHHSLKGLTMENTEIGDEGLAEIATALRLHPQLEKLQLYDNDLGRDGCIALGNSLSSWPHSNKLETLHIGSNAIDDEGLQALVSDMMNCRSLKALDLMYNQSITADGLRSLSPLLQSENNSLETLYLYGINFGDDGAVALAEGLRGNKSLNQLWFCPSEAGITAVGWSAFSKLLCDTSTINNTYLSNHTLTKIGHGNEDNPQYILDYLVMNKDRSDASISKSKILQSHADLDMEPFFEWKTKFLPVIISWLQRAPPSRLGTESNKKICEQKAFCFVQIRPWHARLDNYWVLGRQDDSY